MSLYEKYKDEAEFRDKFVKPLLNRMGFQGVATQHGTWEFGKDFVFSELHRLGGWLHYGVQVKHEDSIGLNSPTVDTIIRQTRQMFAVPFKRTDSVRECHVSAVYIFNSGSITPQAKEYVLNLFAKEHYGDNVHILDGERLDALNQYATYADTQRITARLNGLKLQFHLNNLTLTRMVKDYAEPRSEHSGVKGCSLAGVEQYLTEPFFDDAELYRLMLLYWESAKINSAICDRIAHGSIKDEIIPAERKSVVEVSMRMLKATEKMLTMLAAKEEKLAPIE